MLQAAQLEPKNTQGNEPRYSKAYLATIDKCYLSVARIYYIKHSSRDNNLNIKLLRSRLIIDELESSREPSMCELRKYINSIY